MSYRDSHLERGADYHEKFAPNTYRGMMWGLERTKLIEVVAGLSHRGAYLDFACGTGRIASEMSPHFESSVGVDVSEQMLAIARRGVSQAEFICADITSSTELDGREFDFVTAFRFFPNAEPQLREDVMRKIASMLSADGVFVFNNHKNRSSLIYSITSMVRRRDDGMSEVEVHDLVGRFGLEIIESFHFGVLPMNDRFRFLPLAMIQSIERIAARVPVFRGIASNIMYVCRRVPNG